MYWLTCASTCVPADTINQYLEWAFLRQKYIPVPKAQTYPVSSGRGSNIIISNEFAKQNINRCVPLQTELQTKVDHTVLPMFLMRFFTRQKYSIF